MKTSHVWMVIILLFCMLTLNLSAKALTLDEVVQQSPAFHLITDIYVLINNQYHQLSEWLSFEADQLKINKELDLQGNKITGLAAPSDPGDAVNLQTLQQITGAKLMPMPILSKHKYNFSGKAPKEIVLPSGMVIPSISLKPDEPKGYHWCSVHEFEWYMMFWRGEKYPDLGGVVFSPLSYNDTQDVERDVGVIFMGNRRFYRIVDTSGYFADVDAQFCGNNSNCLAIRGDCCGGSDGSTPPEPPPQCPKHYVDKGVAAIGDLFCWSPCYMSQYPAACGLYWGKGCEFCYIHVNPHTGQVWCASSPSGPPYIRATYKWRYVRLCSNPNNDGVYLWLCPDFS